MKLSDLKVGQKTNIKAGESDSAKELQQVLIHAKEIQDIYNKKIAPIVHKMGGGNMLKTLKLPKKCINKGGRYETFRS